MISPAFAQTATGAGTGGPMEAFGPLIPFVLIAVVFYFLLIRPQQKRLKEHRALIAGIQRGDMVVTSGGLIGKVVKVEDAEIQVELSEGVKVRVVRSTISDIMTKTEPLKAAPVQKKGDAQKKGETQK